MFRAILWSQWKWSWMVVLTAAAAAFAIPIISVQLAAQQLRNGSGAAWGVLNAVSGMSVCYSILAALIGLLLATLAWSSDHRGRHVYALSLPVPRWRYVMMRFGGGALLILAPVIALGISAALSAFSITLPTGLHAYPVAITLRFALAALVAYALVFSISAGTTRTAGYILASIAAVVVADVMLNAAGVQANISQWTLDKVFNWPGVFEVFAGRWMLIDV